MINLDTWIISDTHFGHDNIIKFCDRPQNHDTLMAENWARLVRPKDTILHLGDVAIWRGEASKWKRLIRDDLPGKKFPIKGNHDKHPAKWYTSAGFTFVGGLLGKFTEEDLTREGKPYNTNTVKNYGFYWHDELGRRILFSHYPDAWLLDWDINIHGHIHNNPYSPKLVKIGKEYKNVSIEMTDYRPKRLSDIIDL